MEKAPSGMDLQDLPDLVKIEISETDENLSGSGDDPSLEDIIKGLSWYAYFQIAQMKRRKKRDGSSKIFIEKLNSEIKQT